MVKSSKDIPKDHLTVSLKTTPNTLEIKESIFELFQKNNIHNESVIISNMRHFEALEQAYNELIKVEKGLSEKIPGDLIAMDIRQILFHIGTITGDISSDELLGNIFANFCIGK